MKNLENPEYENVPAHDSQLSDETENESNEPSKRKLKSWVFVKVLTFEEVQPFLEAEKIWS